MKEIYTLNDLPKFSAWPARLLGLEKWQRGERTKEDLLREYDSDKWGSLLERVQKGSLQATLQEVEKAYFEKSQPALCADRGDFKLLNWRESTQFHYDLVKRTLQSVSPSSAIAELGAGYGAIIFRLAQEAEFSSAKKLAADYSPGAVKLMRLISENMKLELDADVCDLSSDKVTDLKIPKSSVLFTNYAVHYQKHLNPGFVEALSALEPKAVVHFEPVYEDYSGDTLVDLLRRRYVEVNHYNLDLLTLLQAKEAAGIIKILRHERSVFGVNALLPVSILIWQPV